MTASRTRLAANVRTQWLPVTNSTATITGYQRDSAKYALAKILEAFIERELQLGFKPSRPIITKTLDLRGLDKLFEG
jgi:hypothetical protein